MKTSGQRVRHALIAAWALAVLIFLYMPAAAITLASLTDSRYFLFPIPRWGFGWWKKTFDATETWQLLDTSISIALCVTVISVVIAFFGALAFARYDWRGRSVYQKLVLLPIFFPQSVLGLALLLWFNAIGLNLSWHTAIFAHLIWVVPVVTLVISIQVYSFDPALEEAAFDLGATRWQVFREVELPLSMPGTIIGFLLTFVLAVGAIAEAKVLGGQKVIPITHDIEIAFTYAQNWPLGAALSVLLMLVVGVLVLLVLRRFDLDAILGKRRQA